MKCKACGVEKAESEFNSYNGILFSECKECKSTKITVKKTRKCRVCKEIKSLDEYGLDSNRVDKKQTTCKECHNKRSREANKNKRRKAYTQQYNKAYRSTNEYKYLRRAKCSTVVMKHKNKMYSMKSKFGLSEPELQHMLNKQKGCCAICKADFGVEEYLNDTARVYVIDHCHDTGKVRGLLCQRCNIIIGAMETKRAPRDLFIKYIDNKGLLNYET